MNDDLAKPVIGPGSQPQDADGEMSFMQMPSGMMIYNQPVLPEPEDISGLEQAIGIAREIHDALTNYQPEQGNISFDISHLDAANREFIDQLLGEGEVSVKWLDSEERTAQESILAGVWRVLQTKNNQAISDAIEIGVIPSRVLDATFTKAQSLIDLAKLTIPEEVYNAPPLISEINDHLANADFSKPHIINLSLLPHTEDDLNYLADILGIGICIILSRGYGNCRISSTQTKNVWWVQYFNSQDTMILNTIEVSLIPEVACAAKEDFEDSAERLGEILSLYDEGAES